MGTHTLPIERFCTQFQPGIFDTWSDALNWAATNSCASKVVTELMQRISSGVRLEAVLVDTQDSVMLDGHHRVVAHLLAKKATVNYTETERPARAIAVDFTDGVSVTHLDEMRSFPAGAGWLEALEVDHGNNGSSRITYRCTGTLAVADARSVAQQRNAALLGAATR